MAKKKRKRMKRVPDKIIKKYLGRYWEDQYKKQMEEYMKGYYKYLEEEWLVKNPGFTREEIEVLSDYVDIVMSDYNSKLQEENPNFTWWW